MTEVDGRARRWDKHNADRRNAVLDAAVEVIEAGGIDVTVKDVADQMGVPRPVVYRYFDGRKDLDEQIRSRILQTLVPELADAMQPDGTLEQTVDRSLGAYLDWIERHPNLHHFLGRDSAVVTHARSAVAAQVSDLIASGLHVASKPTDYARPMAFSLLGLVDGAVNGWRSDTGTTLSAADVQRLTSQAVLTLIQQMASSFGIALTPQTPLREVLG